MKPYDIPPFLEFLAASFERFKRIALLILGSMLLIGGTLMLVGGTKMWLACRGWPQAGGKLLQFSLRPDPEQRRSRLVDLEYEFFVDGQRHTGTWLSPFVADHRIHVWLASWKRTRYQAGQQITVTYDPNNVQTSFLEKPTLVECLARFAATAGLGAWMVYLFFRFRRRLVPATVMSGVGQRAQPGRNTLSPDVGPITLRGISSYKASGSLFSSWPRCRVALVMDEKDFAVVEGPYTKRGIASSLLTVLITCWFQSTFFLILHVTTDAIEGIVRWINWKLLQAERFDRLHGAVPIEGVDIYGLDPHANVFWYRIERRDRDEFIEVSEEERLDADFFFTIAEEYVRLSKEEVG